ncbi:uncharacterized protein SPSK_06569 [Sporothrix schenckii 1099-18]|uniref:Lactate/malate dehydrogenase N-terminal domain-containing protein n=1 Tax=Sporothrix schenckii 1099-18 TaxID=1397361 RepID=A0A0F2MM71_SPOSC|nr:uncharacterized protein SPSK_06569 [Sporothrix schenckii 1099-18]KJR89281.1 hypothetical protein SPSK_06569 [Sporothrix schenckii 1099-18]
MSNQQVSPPDTQLGNENVVCKHHANVSIAIVGVGQIGAAAAYALILGSVAGELLLVDVKVDLREGQVRDLADVTYNRNSRTRVRAATHSEAGQCDIVVIKVGSKHPVGKGDITSVSAVPKAQADVNAQAIAVAARDAAWSAEFLAGPLKATLQMFQIRRAMKTPVLLPDGTRVVAGADLPPHKITTVVVRHRNR